MLTVQVVISEGFDSATQQFVASDSFDLRLEHSLVSLSKWESKFCQPFLDKKERSPEELLGYIEAMTLNENYPAGIFHTLSKENIEAINEYIGSKQTATWFNDQGPQKKSREIITSEIIYYWMFKFTIPIDCERWHLNRLLTLIRVVNEKEKPQKKMSARDLAAQQRRLNAQRRQEMGTRG